MTISKQLHRTDALELTGGKGVLREGTFKVRELSRDVTVIGRGWRHVSGHALKLLGMTHRADG